MEQVHHEQLYTLTDYLQVLRDAVPELVRRARDDVARLVPAERAGVLRRSGVTPGAGPARLTGCTRAGTVGAVLRLDVHEREGEAVGRHLPRLAETALRVVVLGLDFADGDGRSDRGRTRVP